MILKYTEEIHWKIFNFSVKLFAFCAIFVSLIFISLTLLEMAGKVRWLAPYFDSLLVPLIFFAAFLALGVLLLRIKPYKPTTNKNDRFI